MRFLSIIVLAALGACTAADVQPTEPREEIVAAPAWGFAEQAPALRAQSCPEGVSFRRADSISIRVIEAERGTANARDLHFSGMSLAGAWHLESESGFGGLSGLDVMRSGSLLAIADNGKFVWISIDPDTGAPDGIGSMAYMHDGEGNVWSNKRAADAEGLSFRDGLALVSFEQDYRIEAYDLEGCGAAARAALAERLDPVVDGNRLGGNRGPEALALVGDQLSLGFETHASGGSPVGELSVDGTLNNLRRTEQPALYLLTGMDAADGLIAKIFRAYDPVQGPRGLVRVETAEGLIAEAKLKKPLPVDNYEGIAIGRAPSGQTRIWLISDDNFSNSQRTLLLALDLDPAS
ncbi:MAG: esterase-like activity of phytase family protein [Henriciella sp.]|nr:esterase-like activity of phytase family protein [Henriciella sp.]